jgi:hypothetical protein
MLTVTLRHDVHLPLRALKSIVMGAFRAARQSRPVRSIYDEKVRATMRAVEVTHGANGWHPHLHVLMLTEDWTPEERATFQACYERAVQRLANKAGVLYSRVAPKRGVAMKWSNAKRTQAEIEKCNYLAKLGWEMTNAAGKGDPQFAIARRAVAGDEHASSLWREYTAAMKGTRLIELDERACSFAGSKVGDGTCELEPVELHVEIGPYRLMALRDAERTNPTVTRDVLVEAARAGPSEWRVLAAFDALTRACYDAQHVGMGHALSAAHGGGLRVGREGQLAN